jgi:hypothetical protein
MSRRKPFVAGMLAAAGLVLGGCPPGSSELPPPNDPNAAPTLGAPTPPRVTHLGGMVIESSPPGMVVRVNNKRVGTTPVTVDGLAPGTYDVTYEDPRDGDVSYMVEVADGAYPVQSHATAPTAADAKFPGK